MAGETTIGCGLITTLQTMYGQCSRKQTVGLLINCYQFAAEIGDQTKDMDKLFAAILTTVGFWHQLRKTIPAVLPASRLLTPDSYTTLHLLHLMHQMLRARESAPKLHYH